MLWSTTRHDVQTGLQHSRVTTCHYLQAPLSTLKQRDTQVDSTVQDQSTLSSTSITNNGGDTNARRMAASNSSQGWGRLFACNRAIEHVSPKSNTRRVDSTGEDHGMLSSTSTQLSRSIPPPVRKQRLRNERNRMQCRFKEVGVKSCMQLCDCSFRAPLSTRHQRDTQVDSTGQDQSTLSSTSTQ